MNDHHKKGKDKEDTEGDSRNILALFEGIDENTQLLSPLNLQKTINVIETQLEKTKTEICDIVNEEYSQFRDNLQKTLTINEDVHKLEKELSTINAMVHEPSGIYPSLIDIVASHQTLQTQLTLNEKVVTLLKVFYEIWERIQYFDTLFKCSIFGGAVDTLFEIEHSLDNIPKFEEGDPKITSALRDELRLRKKHLKEQLPVVFKETVFIDANTLIIKCDPNENKENANNTNHNNNDSNEQNAKSNSKKKGKEKGKGKSADNEILPDASEANPGINSEIKSSKGILFEILSGMEKLEIWGKIATQLSSDLWKNIFSPIFSSTPNNVTITIDNNSIKITITNTENNDSKNNKRDSKKLKVDSESQTVDPSLVYQNIINIVSFLKDKVFQGRVSMLRAVGNNLWVQLSNSLIKFTLDVAIPMEREQLGQFQKITTSTRDFELSLSEESGLGFIGVADRQLSHYVEDVDIHFAEKKCLLLLEKVRSMILGTDHSTLTVGVEIKTKRKNPKEVDLNEGYFFFPKCAITIVARDLVSLIEEALKEASTSSPHCSSLLYQASRSALDVFRTLYPTFHAAKISSIPSIAAAFHNDLMYIAHSLLTPMRYNINNDSNNNTEQTSNINNDNDNTTQSNNTLNNNSIYSMSDLVPVFRSMAETVWLNQIKIQWSVIVEHLDSMNGLSNTGDPRRGQVVEGGLKRTVHHITHLSKIWGSVLPKSMYLSVMGGLIEAVLSKLLTEVLYLRNIMEDESHKLNQVLGEVTKVKTVFGEDQNLIGIWVSNFDKFSKIVEIMEMPLVRIAEEWKARILFEIGFKPIEVKSLIEALFSDSPLRRQSLESIR
eukprot:TRINITY_DN6413_c0_g2_i1.p1 TRINITY_DN6413_c0_g2~~TRINITY_DN6413_c0_g2_i1.p1  ORF type:complete len:847 (+),score=217.24 TRINITY_DN6413_c0_g2_i1:41-2542(+)